ncbi:MAG: WG repeat-containing protein [Bacteroidota bacterium]
MRYSWLSYFLIFILAWPVHLMGQEDLLMPKKNEQGHYGYVNQYGKKRIDFRFDYAEAYHQNRAVVMLEDSFYYINPAGKILSPGYELAYPFLEKYTIVGQNGKYGFIDTNFVVRQNRWFSKARLFQRGYAIAETQQNRFLLNQQGRILKVSKNYKIPVQGAIQEVAEEMAYYPGGADRFNDYVRKNISFTVSQPLVYVALVVEKNGELSHIEVLGNLSESQQKDIIKVLKRMPVWVPAREGNEVVRLRMSIPLVLNQRDNP